MSSIFRPSRTSAWCAVVCTALAWSAAARAQVNPRFESLWLEQGLPDKTVRTVVQDAQGFIWLGTSYGLTRFDGMSMVTFVADAAREGSLSHDRISDLHRDARGRLWVATRGGLNRYRPETRTFQVFRHDPEHARSLSSDGVLALEDGEDGTLWIGTHSGLDHLDPETGHVRRLADRYPVLQGGRVRALHRTSDGRLYVGTRNGVFFYDPRSEKVSPLPSLEETATGPEVLNGTRPLGQTRINAITSDATGQVWIGSHGQGLLRFDPTTDTLTPQQDAVGDKVVFSLTIDTADNLWVGTMAEGLFRRSTEGAWSQFRYDSGDATSLRDNTVLALYIDRSETLWAGSFQAGVHRLGLKSLDFGRHDNSKNSLSCLPSAVVNDLAVSNGQPASNDLSVSDGMQPSQPHTLLVATDAGLAAIDRTRDPATGRPCMVYTHEATNSTSLSSSTVLSLHRKADGSTWAGTLRGLDRLDLVTGTVQRIPEIRDVAVYALAESRSGSLWVGTTDGLYRSSGDSFDLLPLPDSIPPPLKVNSIAIDSTTTKGDEQIWLGTNRGLLTWPTGSGQLGRPPVDELPELALWVGAVHVDDNDTVWVGVDGVGLFALPPAGEAWDPMRNGDELPDFQRFGTLLSDSHGDLWAATPRGLFRIDISNRSVTPFHTSDGLQSDDFIGNSAYRDATGRFFLGGRRGFNVFRPESIRLDETVPEVRLTQLFHFNEAVAAGEEHQGFRLPGPIDQLDTVTLTHRDYVFGFEFAALHFSAPTRNRYIYRLEGFDPDWIRTDARNRRATYTNLAPGSYRFQVKAANPHGVWNDQGASLQVEVLPAPWATWWAYTAYFLLTVATIVFVFMVRTVALRRRAADLEAGVRERTAIIETLLEEKDEEIATFSHELRTPLTLILGPIKSVLKTIDEPAIQQKLWVVRRNGFRLLRMVDQLLHLQRFRVQRALPRRPQAVQPTIEALGESFAELALERNIRVTVGPVADLWLSLVPDTLEKVLLNLLSNAIKYTPDGGRVEISAQAEGDVARIIVSDTGIGIAAEHRTKIFQRYQRVLNDESERVTGAGIGLALVRDLVEAHGGTIEVESTLGEGSAFILRLPRTASPEGAKRRALDAGLLELEIQTLAEQQGDFGEVTHAAAQVQPTSPEDGRPIVLVIEDNPDMLRYIADTLATGYACRTASNGERGLELAWQDIPDLVVSDIMMPKVDGYEVLRRLKDDERSSHIPVILLTARGDRKSRHRGWRERADEYLTKPFDEEELLLRVGNLLEIREILRQRFAQEFALGTPKANAGGEELNPRDREFLDKFRQMIAQHYADPELRLPQMTSIMALSERPLQRKLKALLGRTPIELLRTYRLTKANELLQEGLLVAEVADRTGFSSQAYFATCFKAQFGVTPSESRDRSR